MVTVRQIIEQVFPGMPVDETIIARLPEVVKTLNEREQCIIEKRLTGNSLANTGKKVINLGTGRNFCDGISAERVRTLYYHAIQKLKTQSRKKVWSFEMNADQWLKRYMK